MLRSLMLMGTGSDVGKSVLVAGLCRALLRRGLRVLPFKPQNMSNNAAVTRDGGEIGRAQALQARACGVEPMADMNPVLLKPQSDTGAQLIVRGRVQSPTNAADYQRSKGGLLETVLNSYQRLRSQADVVVVEGAGSPAEVNLRAGDIANMGFALAAQLPVVMVGDIDRGGVIASLIGTHALLPIEERRLIRGFIINKFRGDVRLFDGGRQIITQQTGWRDYGVLPWLNAATRLPAEDAVVLDRATGRASGKLRIAVPLLSRIANFDDLDPLRAEPGVEVCLIPPGKPLPVCELVVLPGTKASLPDLEFFRRQCWDVDLQAHVRRGGKVLGLCGGYQMLGTRLADPEGVEGPRASVEGLGLLDVETRIAGSKHLANARGVHIRSGHAVHGYEMHMGRTRGPATSRPLVKLEAGRFDGAVSQDALVAGTYLHGLFNADAFRAWFIEQLGGTAAVFDFEASIDSALDELAEGLERHLALEALLDLQSSRRA